MLRSPHSRFSEFSGGGGGTRGGLLRLKRMVFWSSIVKFFEYKLSKIEICYGINIGIKSNVEV